MNFIIVVLDCSVLLCNSVIMASAFEQGCIVATVQGTNDVVVNMNMNMNDM